MVKNHLKRIFVPKTWPIMRKEEKFITRPFPGGQSMEHSLPIVVVLKDLLKVARTTREVRYILNNEEVLINGKKKQRPEDSLGLMDVISFPKTKETYRLMLTSRNILKPILVAGEEANMIPSKLKRKTSLKKDVVQLSFHNGNNLLLTEAEAKKYALGDTLLVGLDNKIIKHLPLTKDATVLFIKGSHIGKTALIKSRKNTMVEVVSKDKNNEEDHFETKRAYAFVVGSKGKSELKLVE